MSQDLYWRLKGKGKHIPCDMKLREIMREKGFELSIKDVPFIEGLVAAGVRGSDELLKIIYEHDEIEIYIE